MGGWLLWGLASTSLYPEHLKAARSRQSAAPYNPVDEKLKGSEGIGKWSLPIVAIE
jgi:hypothetical protein